MSLSSKDREASQKIEEHETSSAGSDYNSCWGKFCSPSKSSALRDVLRGLLVLVVVGVISAIIFLLCYFLIHDLEKKDESLVKDIARELSKDEPKFTPMAEFSISSNDNNNNKLKVLPTYPTMIKKLDPIDDLYSNTRPEQIAVTEYEEHSTTPREDYQQVNTQDLGFKNIHVHDIRTVLKRPEEKKAKCEPMKLQLCSGSMPWTETKFPNWINNTNAGELQESLAYFQSVIVESRCSRRATEYTCAILEPPCGPDAKTLPPCKSFCLGVLSTCSEYLVDNSIENYAFDCDRFPDSADPNVCVDVHKDLSESRVVVEENSEVPLVAEGRAIFQDSTSLEENILNRRQPLESDTTDLPQSIVEVHNEIIPEQPLELPQPAQEPNKSSPDNFEPLICVHSKFLCDDGSDCLDTSSICNGISDCLDSSDEKILNCPKSECAKHESLCNQTKTCIPNHWVCDGTDDCGDNSDEDDCVTLNRNKIIALESNPSPDFNLRQNPVIREELPDLSGGNDVPYDWNAREREDERAVYPVADDIGVISQIPDNFDKSSSVVLSQFSKFDNEAFEQEEMPIKEPVLVEEPVNIVEEDTPSNDSRELATRRRRLDLNIINRRIRPRIRSNPKPNAEKEVNKPFKHLDSEVSESNRKLSRYPVEPARRHKTIIQTRLGNRRPATIETRIDRHPIEEHETFDDSTDLVTGQGPTYEPKRIRKNRLRPSGIQRIRRPNVQEEILPAAVASNLDFTLEKADEISRFGEATDEHRQSPYYTDRRSYLDATNEGAYDNLYQHDESSYNSYEQTPVESEMIERMDTYYNNYEDPSHRASPYEMSPFARNPNVFSQNNYDYTHSNNDPMAYHYYKT